MNNKFVFLSDKFPKLAEYGQKAIEAFRIDNNICILNLGRIAETITEFLCRRNNIIINDDNENIYDKLYESGTIDKSISIKLKTLTEIKEDAANNNYDSELAASKLIDTAVELCEWFVSDEGLSRFSFLGDIFPENAPFPPLSNMAEYGNEAEENLYQNRRYCLLCLGDIEEAIVDLLLERAGIIVPKGMDQDAKINKLFNVIGMNNTDKIDTLHRIRQIRNDAIHSRYTLEENAVDCLNDTLNLCEWLFMFIVSSGDFMRGRITEINQDGLEILTGRISGYVPLNEIPEQNTSNLKNSYRTGEQKIFRVISKDDDKLILSMTQANHNAWLEMARRYEKYYVGQILNVTVKKIHHNFGALVDVNDSCARIPRSEYGKKGAPLENSSVQARVKWVDPLHYPYMILSIMDAEEIKTEEYKSSKPDKWENNKPEPKKLSVSSSAAKKITKNIKQALTIPESNQNVLSDSEFLALCKNGSEQEIIDAINDGANIHAVDNNKTNALMIISMTPKIDVLKMLIDHGADVNSSNNTGTTPLLIAVNNNQGANINELIENGADVNAVNNKGISPLSMAVMNNKSEYAAQLIEHGADINFVNKKGASPLLIAIMNNKHDCIKELLKHDVNVLLGTKGEKMVIDYARMNLKNKSDLLNEIEAMSKRALMDLCKDKDNGNEDEIMRAVEHGIDVNGRSSKSHNTTLIYAARNKSARVVEALIENGADVNARNNDGVNALIWAVMYNDVDVVRLLVENGGDVEVEDKFGHDVFYYADERGDEEIMRVLESLPDEEQTPSTTTDDSQIDSSQVIEDSQLDTDSSQQYESSQPDNSQIDNAQTDESQHDNSQSVDISQNDIDSSQQYETSQPVDLSKPDIDSSQNEASQPESTQPTEPALTPEQQLESETALRMTLQRDILKIARSGSIDDINQAIELNVNLNVKNKSHATPLMFAAQSNSSEIIELLINNGAQINSQDIKGMTPLMYAAAFNTEDVVDKLIELGADINIINNSGFKAIDYARKNHLLIDTDSISKLQ